MLKINRENLKSSHQLTWFIIDFVMLGLLILNLALIIWDSIYNFIAVQNLLKDYAPAIQELYHPIHERFIFYDLIFVSIFLGEFVLRWGYSIKARVYDRWYFYPFIHWYDLVGYSGRQPPLSAGAVDYFHYLPAAPVQDHRLHHPPVPVCHLLLRSLYGRASDRIVLKVLSGV